MNTIIKVTFEKVDLTCILLSVQRQFKMDNNYFIR